MHDHVMVATESLGDRISLFHYNFMGPLSCMWSVTDQNTITWHMFLFHQNSHVGILKPNVVVQEGGPLGGAEVMRVVPS